ncbi:hypothetical protein DIS24_g5073 [Lasiodiplodia hormozganensis]|uniref:BTB domain-containing protein n=1 Tax=Lasiodiplodia hormozganensis TaxID=869390 RepID=A0AA39YL45_9PEZI|nr:hypothetical protein DIS24_g5073 [Lasiodiplodia hormozganensis]
MAKGKATEKQIASEQPPSFINGTLSNAITSVFVGPGREKFVTYTDLLGYWSPRIDAVFDMFDSEHLMLPTVSPAVFRVFLDWMRSDGDQLPRWSVRHRHDTPREPVKVADHEVLENPDAYYRSQPEAEALECYIFANEYNIRQFKNDLFDSILEMNPGGNLVPSYSIVLRVWDALAPSSPMRKYLIDLFARNWTYETDIGNREELILRKQVPAAFWIDILTLRDKHGELDDYPPWEENLCQYHEHSEEEARVCYWQHINNGEGYCTDYTDDDDDDSAMDEYESDFIDDAEIDSDGEPKLGSPHLGTDSVQEDNMEPMKMEAELQHGYGSSDSIGTSDSLTL